MNPSPLDKLLILDGGMSTELRRLGCEVVSGTPLWTAALLVNNPDVVRQAHVNFFKAGASIALTCSYHASFAGFNELGMTEEQGRSAIENSVRLAREAAAEVSNESDQTTKPTFYVAGSIGPYGVVLHDASEYNGHYMNTTAPEIIVDYYFKQATALVNAGVDFLAFETVPATQEALLILEALRRFDVAPAAWISFSCKDATHTNFGEQFEEAVKAVQDFPSVFAVGVNCTAPQHIEGLLMSASGVARKPFVVYPNLYNEEKSKQWKCDASNEQMLFDNVNKWVKLNARIIGGCCEVDSTAIRAIAHYLR